MPVSKINPRVIAKDVALSPIKVKDILAGHENGIGFVEVEGATAVVIKKKTGVYEQVKVATQKEYVYVKLREGYARVYKSGATTHPLYSVENLDPGDLVVAFDDMGRLVVLDNVAALKAKAAEMRE